MPRGRVDLHAELDTLAVTSAAALRRLQDGDPTGVLELVERREWLLHVLTEWPAAADTGLMEAARRAVALDIELMATLRARHAEVAVQLAEVLHARRSLASYGATPPPGALYVERLG